MGIHSVLIFNNAGKPRLTKFYTHMKGGVAAQQSLLKQIYLLISERPEGVCNFLDAPELRAMLSADAFKGGAVGGPTPASGQAEALRVIYRHYATLYFVFVVDGSESELGILDLIQVSRLPRVCHGRLCRPWTDKARLTPTPTHRSLSSRWTAALKTCASST